VAQDVGTEVNSQYCKKGKERKEGRKEGRIERKTTVCPFG
jgi:hypothetical protein